MNWVCYHKNCADGFTGAWVFWREFKACGKDVEFYAVQYGRPMPWQGADPLVGAPGLQDDVYFVDFCPEREVLEDLAANVRRLVVLDHHESRAEMLRDWLLGLDGFGEGRFGDRYDGGTVFVGRSGKCEIEVQHAAGSCGARLAWEWWRRDDPAPVLIDYVEDRDLWRWKLRRSREVSAYVRNQRYGFEEWEALARFLGTDGGSAAATLGETILQRDGMIVDSLTRRPVWVEIGGHCVPAVPAGVLQSEVCERLLEDWPEAGCAACWREGRGEDGSWDRVWSLRSRPGGDPPVNVAEIAKNFGGGGHACAAGFVERGLQPAGLLAHSRWPNVVRDQARRHAAGASARAVADACEGGGE